jgi:hypothetical protein
VKYKKKKISKNKYSDDRGCIDEASYAQFSQAAALIEAQQQADRRFMGATRSRNGCTWSTRVEVRNARYEAQTGTNSGYGLQPLPRCQIVNNPGDGSSLDPLGGTCKDGRPQETNEYIPGGSRPPCPNNAEGTCVYVDRQKSWSQGSSWKVDPTEPFYESAVTLTYDFRVVPNSVINRPSGRNCTKPDNDPWQTKTGAGLTSCARCKAKMVVESRCYDETVNYDCCCSCQPVEVPDVAYCTSPNYDQSRYAAINQAYALLALGMCSAAIGVTAPLWGIAAGAGCVIVGTTMIYGACTNP